MLKWSKLSHSQKTCLSMGGLLLAAVVGLCVVSYHNTISPRGIIIHHSAVPPRPGEVQDARLLEGIHARRGYGIFYWGRIYHIGYHYVILPDGTIQAGRPEHCQGAHARGYNTYIGVCLIGDFSSADNPRGEMGLTAPTDAQLESLAKLARELRGRYGFPPENIRRHNEVSPDTECPGDRLVFPGSPAGGEDKEGRR